MSERPRRRWVLDFQGARASGSRSVAATELRCPTRDDADALARLMLDAYAGTMDDEGESLEDAHDEVRAYFDNEPLLGHSSIAFVGDTAAAAILLTMRRGEPLVGYVITGAEHKRQGLARAVLDAAVRSLREARWSRAIAFITEGNTPSEALFASVGAVMSSEEEEGPT